MGFEEVENSVLPGRNVGYRDEARTRPARIATVNADEAVRQPEPDADLAIVATEGGDGRLEREIARLDFVERSIQVEAAGNRDRRFGFRPLQRGRAESFCPIEMSDPLDLFCGGHGW